MTVLRKTTLWTLLLLAGWVSPALAWHGNAASTERDAWIDQSLAGLVTAGLIKPPARELKDLTNLEVAGLTAEATRLLAQAVPSPALDLAPPPAGPADLLPPPAAALPDNSALPGLLPTTTLPQTTQSLQQLIEEFKAELSVLGVDVDKLEDRLNDDRARREIYAALQAEYLKRTGTEIGGFSRGYMYNYRGFGNAAAYSAMDYNAAIFMEMDLRSIPVPSLLFDARIRFWRSIGMYYQDPIQPEYQLRWFSLLNRNDVANLTFGDFYKNYSPLTLWNSGAPVYTLIEPSSFQRTRKDVQELVYMDQAPDWHLRGFQAESGRDWAKDFLSSYRLQVMAGTLQDATASTFSSYYAGSQDSFGLADEHLSFKGTGLLLWQDPNSANVPYLPDFPSTFAKQYQVGSLETRLSIPFGDKTDLSLSSENAYAQYNDDANDATRVFGDWAFLGRISLNIETVHLTAKYLEIGPYYYSPGAQTNSFSPVAGFQGYLSSTLFGIDDALPGWLNNFAFQDVTRPNFAPYDRLSENILPYGEASPNRTGLVLGFSADLGPGGWLKPQGSFMLKDGSLGLREIQPEFIFNDLGASSVTGNLQTRLFSGYEGALTMDLAQGLGLKGTYRLQLDNKHQATDFQDGSAPFTVDTLILAADFNIPVAFFKPVVWSAALESVHSTGSEYVLKGEGNPTSLGRYPFYLDNTVFNNNVTYSPQALNLTRNTYAFGVLYPLSDKINFRFDYFLIDYKWDDVPGYERYEHIGRFTYEAHF